MAKPVLGRGLGELLKGNSAREPGTATETRTAAPRLSAGMSTLVRRSDEPSAPSARTPSLIVLRASLLLADAALVGGAMHHSLNDAPPGWMTTTSALLAVLLGAWLGWLGLTWGRAER